MKLGVSILHCFNWKYNFSLDEKFRLQIPSEVRNSLKDSDNRTFVITKGFHDCLYAFPKSAWESRIQSNFPDDLPTEVKYERLQALSSWSVNCVMDSQYRVKIPEELIQHASLEHKVTIAGVSDRLEIWNTDSYIKHHQEFVLDPKEIVKDILL